MTHENLQVTVTIIVNKNEATFRLVYRRLTVYVGHAFITIKKLICLFSKAIVKMPKEKIDLLLYQQEMSENPLHYACIFLNFTKALFCKGKETWKTTTCTYKEKTYPVDEMGQQSFTDITIINCALNVPLMIISISANSLVLAAMLTTPSLRSPSTVFLCCLTISDILVGFIAQPVYIATELERAPLLYGAMFALTSLACGVSVCTMAVISVDRYLALHYHMTYPHIMTEKRALYITLTVWLTGALVSCINLWNKSLFFYVTAVGIGVCITISTISYVKIFLIVRQHQLQIQVQHQAVQNLSTANRTLHLNKSAINTFIYFMFMILCYSPLFASMLILAIYQKHETEAWNFADTISFMNSSINPVLYCWRLRELRTAVLKILRKMSCSQIGES